MAEPEGERNSIPSGSTLWKPDEEVQGAEGEPCAFEMEQTVLSARRPSPAGGTSRSAIAEQLAGEMLGHYRIDSYVAIGGMGAVFRATDVRLDRAVALKILPPEQARDPAIVSRFHQEARAAARLDHENIARVFYVGEDRGLHFIAFEFIEGANVRDLIRQHGRLSVPETVNYAIQITGALVHAASRGVVHRDIKPSNIIITASGRAKLVDMGLARRFERGSEGGLTQSGMTLGTFDYIAPEQATEPRQADTRSDIYSLGCTLYHMLTGQPPYPQGTVLQKLIKHRDEPPPDVRHLNPTVPPLLAAVISRMMAKDPKDRYQTAEELLSDLLDVAASLGLRSTSPEGLIWLSEGPRRPARWLLWAVWLSAAAALLIVVAGLWWWPGLADGRGRPAAASAELYPQPPTPLLQQAGPLEPPPSSPPTQAGADSQLSAERPTAVGPAVAASNLRPDTSRPAESTKTAAAETDRSHPARQLLQAASSEELRTALEQAHDGAVIELTGPGPYRPQEARGLGQDVGIIIAGKELTVRAGPGRRPRLVLAFDSGAEDAVDWTMFRLLGAQISFDGIEFELDAGDTAAPLSAFDLQSSQVQFRRCWFWQTHLPPEAAEHEVPSLVRLAAGGQPGGEQVGSQLMAAECYFAGGAQAFAIGPGSRLSLQECVVLPYRSTFKLLRRGRQRPEPAELVLQHVTLFGSDRPMFELGTLPTRVEAGAVTFSWQTAEPGTLVLADQPADLQWRELAANLYHRAGRFLVLRSAGELVPAAGSFDNWRKRMQIHPHSRVADTMPFVMSLAEARKLAGGEPDVANAFRIRRSVVQSWPEPPGARFLPIWTNLYASISHPLGSLVQEPAVATTEPPGSTTAGKEQQRPEAGSDAQQPTSTGAGTHSVATPPEPSDMQPAGPMPTLPMPDMDTAAAPAPAQPASTSARSEPVRPAPRTETRQPASGRTLVVNPADPQALPSVAAACAQAEDGAVIEIAHSGTLSEPPIVLGDHRLTIRAAAGTRVTLRLETDNLALEGRAPSLFTIRNGSLKLLGLDFLLDADPTVSTDRWSLVSSQGADVSLENCTAIFQNDRGLPSCLVRYAGGGPADDSPAPMPATFPATPRLSLRNCLVLGPGNLLWMQPTGPLRIHIENCAVAVSDYMVVNMGGQPADSREADSELLIQHSTIHAPQGLLSYRASESAPWPPHLEVSAADSIFVGSQASPLIHFRSPLPVDDLRHLLHWKGMNNTYGGLATVWQLSSTSMSSGPMDHELDWQDWQQSQAGQDDVNAEQRETIRFAQPPDPNTELWNYSAGQFRLHPDDPAVGSASDGGDRGVDTSRLPARPRNDRPGHSPGS